MVEPMAGNAGGADSRRLSYEQLAEVMAAAPYGIVVTDPRQPGDPIVYVNEQFTAITGYGADEAVGRSLDMLKGPGTDPRALEEIDDAVHSARSSTIELLNYRKGGEPVWMRVQIRPVFDREGQLCHLVGGLTDMTERRLIEDAMRESEERLRAVMGAMPLPMLRVRLDGSIIEANRHAHDILGVTAGSLPGRNVYEFGLEDDDGTTKLCEDLRALGAARRMEIRARREDGTPIWLLASGRMFTVRGETRYLLICQDVTELKRREQALELANQQAERTIRARMSFLAAASHDLRQPLQALALFASALENHAKTPQARTIVQSMKISLRGMEEMFDSLLDMSRLDAGVITVEPQVFLINDIFERLETNYQPQAAAAGLDLRFVASSAAVRSDPKLLSRIISNFLSNAIRYTRAGRILVGCRLSGPNIKVIVCDTGAGIPDSQRLEIFKEFRQGSTPTLAGRGVGMGLGLSIVQRLSRLLNHRLDVRSVVDKGTAFSVEVPLVEEWAPQPCPGPPDEDVREVEGATVVVVDDDVDIRDGLKLLLQEWGCRAVVAATAEQALAELSRTASRPDIILADLHLRHAGSGVAAIRSIFEHTGTTPPAFLFTGDTEAPLDVRDGSGAFPVLRKPIDPLRLRTLLADALGK
jgi:two-component system, sensor histidine kinase